VELGKVGKRVRLDGTSGGESSLGIYWAGSNLAKGF